MGASVRSGSARPFTAAHLSLLIALFTVLLNETSAVTPTSSRTLTKSHTISFTSTISFTASVTISGTTGASASVSPSITQTSSITVSASMPVVGSSGLSLGDQAGIAVSVIVSVGILGAAAVYFAQQRKKKQQQGALPTYLKPGMQQPPSMPTMVFNNDSEPPKRSKREKLSVARNEGNVLVVPQAPTLPDSTAPVAAPDAAEPPVKSSKRKHRKSKKRSHKSSRRQRDSSASSASSSISSKSSEDEFGADERRHSKSRGRSTTREKSEQRGHSKSERRARSHRHSGEGEDKHHRSHRSLSERRRRSSRKDRNPSPEFDSAIEAIKDIVRRNSGSRSPRAASPLARARSATPKASHRRSRRLHVLPSGASDVGATTIAEVEMELEEELGLQQRKTRKEVLKKQMLDAATSRIAVAALASQRAGLPSGVYPPDGDIVVSPAPYYPPPRQYPVSERYDVDVPPPPSRYPPTARSAPRGRAGSRQVYW